MAKGKVKLTSKERADLKDFTPVMDPEPDPAGYLRKNRKLARELKKAPNRRAVELLTGGGLK